MSNERIFEIRNNKQGTPMKIIRYGSISDIDIQFMDEYGHIVYNAAYNISTINSTVLSTERGAL